MAINKQVFASLAAFTLALGLAGCSSSPAEEPEKTDKPVASSAPSEKPEETEKAEEPEETAPATEGDTAAPGTTVAVGEEAIVSWEPSRMSTVSAHVAHALAAHTDHIFGVMGNGNAYFLDALERSGSVTFTAVRHEMGGVVAADAYYRAGGGLAVATATYGAGFTNTLTALAEAAQARIPLVLVVGDEPTSGPRPWDVDQIALAAAVGARTYTVGRTDAAATTIIAIEHALNFRVPVVLALPYDVSAIEAGEVPALPELRRPAPITIQGDVMHAHVTAAAAALTAAKKPYLLAGVGAWLADAGEALGELAAATGALTSSTALGRGIFPEQRFDLGVTGGFGAEGAMDLIREADVAVVFGAGLNQFTMRF
uniref:Thiamine pyrophosphate-binding protein n=1 Tax=Parastrongyloides trichosuri TaxID=131310 RepID=A0A0N4ZIV9_PARTI